MARGPNLSKPEPLDILVLTTLNILGSSFQENWNYIWIIPVVMFCIGMVCWIYIKCSESRNEELKKEREIHARESWKALQKEQYIFPQPKPKIEKSSDTSNLSEVTSVSSTQLPYTLLDKPDVQQGTVSNPTYSLIPIPNAPLNKIKTPETKIKLHHDETLPPTNDIEPFSRESWKAIKEGKYIFPQLEPKIVESSDTPNLSEVTTVSSNQLPYTLLDKPSIEQGTASNPTYSLDPALNAPENKIKTPETKIELNHDVSLPPTFTHLPTHEESKSHEFQENFDLNQEGSNLPYPTAPPMNDTTNDIVLPPSDLPYPLQNNPNETLMFQINPELPQGANSFPGHLPYPLAPVDVPPPVPGNQFGAWKITSD